MEERNKIKSMKDLYENRQNTGYRNEGVFYRSMGNTLVKVTVCLSENAESAEEKLIRIIKKNIETKENGCDIIRLPQMSQPQEGGSDEQ